MFSYQCPHKHARTHLPSSEDFGQEHAVDSFRRAFGEVVRVDSFTGKVGSLSEHGGVFATDSGVEVVLADALHHVGRGAVEEVTLAQLPVPLRHTPRHVLLLPVGAEEEKGDLSAIHSFQKITHRLY